MKKRKIAIVIVVLVLLISSITYSNSRIGDKINDVLFTDIVTEINGQEVESFNINGSTAIYVSEAKKLGYQINWDGENRLITIINDEANNPKYIENKLDDSESNNHQIGDKINDVLFTDIVTKINGQEVESFNINGSTAIFVNSFTKISGVTINWNPEQRKVIVSGEVSEKLNNMIGIVKNKIVFKNDISLFTTYAFMNFTGYDDENNQQGYHEVRSMIKEDLKKLDLQLKDNKYYLNRNVNNHYYRHILSKTEGAPDFIIKSQLPSYLNKLSINDLSEHLEEFYTKANISELYEKYNHYYEKEMELYSESIYPVIAKTNLFLDIKESQIPEFYFQVNLQDAYWRGSGIATVYQPLGKPMLITGPSYTPNLINVVHEYLHGFITPINNELNEEIEELSYLMKEVPQNTQATSSSYNNWFSIFDESLIRALDNRYLDDKGYIESAMRHGFILTEYFAERFDEYGKFNGTLKEFICMLIIDLQEENH